MVDYVKQGTQNRAAGARFELKVREHQEKYGWTVDKWTNNIDLDEQKIVKAKSFRGITRGNGFPDFICWEKCNILTKNPRMPHYRLKFIECKVNGYLKPEEKQKLNFLVTEGHKCFVASRGERGTINYIEWIWKLL